MWWNDFFYSAGHIALDEHFKEGSGVVFNVAAEHVNNLSVALNSPTTDNINVAETIQNLIDITRFGLLKKAYHSYW